MCEIALAVVLLAGAGVMMKSLMALHNVELGFQPANVLVMKATGVRSRQENKRFSGRCFRELRLCLESVAVGATSVPPGDLSLAGSGGYFLDRIPPPAERNRATEPIAF